MGAFDRAPGVAIAAGRGGGDLRSRLAHRLAHPPHGQLLLVTGGNGWFQARGEAAVQVGPGDVVWIEPGEEHWHGSLPDTLLRHILVQEHENDTDVYLAGPLAEGEYPPEQHRENPTNGEPA